MKNLFGDEHRTRNASLKHFLQIAKINYFLSELINKKSNTSEKFNIKLHDAVEPHEEVISKVGTKRRVVLY